MSPLFGIVLAGGRSRRMGTPKPALDAGGRSFLEHTIGLLRAVCREVWVSRAPDTVLDVPAGAHGVLVDDEPDGGPLVAIRTALNFRTGVAWLVVAVDMPLLTADALARLAASRAPGYEATAFRNPETDGPEPLCTIFETSARRTLTECADSGERSVRRALSRLETRLVEPVDDRILWNANTPEDLELKGSLEYATGRYEHTLKRSHV